MPIELFYDTLCACTLQAFVGDHQHPTIYRLYVDDPNVRVAFSCPGEIY